tara:strand:- start:3580 stop:4998 length:1419 start_codon:yes stop_codon:yes gene_type:complete
MITKVFGPPGTGKTTYLIDIAKKYLEEGTPLNRIGYFAFTRKAANEAKNRMPFDNKKLTYFQTLHSLAFHTLGLSEDNIMQPYHYDDLGKILNVRVHHIDKFNDSETFYLTSDNLYFQLIGRAKNKDISFLDEYNVGDYTSEDIDFDLLKHIGFNLEEYKEKNDLIDFNDMIHQFIKNKKKCPEFDVVFIDEAQDLSPIQWKMFEILKGKSKDIYLAGDDDQAIYSWAGADVDTFIDQKCDKEIILDQSRRVPFAIQEISEIILNRIEGKRKEKKYRPKQEEGKVQKILDISQVDLTQGHWLILARTGSRLKDIMELLREQGIYYQNKKGKSFKVKLYNAYLNYNKDSELTEAEMKDILEYTNGKKPDATPWYEAFVNAPHEEVSYIKFMISNGENLQADARVRLSTIHAAKGGEEDNVILVLDNARKIRRAILDNQNKRDEEHRVWYVGATRARKNLYLHAAKKERNGYDL